MRRVRKTSSSSTSTNWVFDGSKGDKARCEMKEAGREAESKNRDPETAHMRTVLSHFCSIRNKTPFKVD